MAAKWRMIDHQEEKQAKRGGRDDQEAVGDEDEDEDEFSKGGKKWISGAIKHPGALHRDLGVPQGQKIPAKKLAAAKHSDNPKIRQRANLASTLKKMH